MDNTFYWHDYETFGINPSIDRPSQFAGLRTDIEHRLHVLLWHQRVGTPFDHQQPTAGDLRSIRTPQMSERLVDLEGFGMHKLEGLRGLLRWLARSGCENGNECDHGSTSE